MAAKKNAGGSVPAKRKKNTDPALYDYGEDVGAGVDELGREDLAIPFIYVLQFNSPEIELLEGAKAGMIMNSVSQKLYDGTIGVQFVPVHRQHVFTEWVPRDAGGGFVAQHDPQSDVVVRAKEDSEAFGKYKMRDGNDLVETFYVYGLLLDPDDGPQPMVMPFSSTKIKKYKGWMTIATNVKTTAPDGRRVNPPMFAHRYQIAGVKDKNQYGDFWNVAISFAEATAAASRLAPDDPIYQEARAFRELAVVGRARPDTEGARAEDDEKIPF
jgi:hypothetical protein